MENLNQKTSVMLTERDFSILKSLYDNVVMSFPQISRRHFVERSKPTVVNRLARLEMAGMITKFKVPRLEVTSTQGVISVVYQISKSGILALQKRHCDIELRSEPVRLRPYSIDHDLLLVDVVAALKNKWPDFNFINGELFQANQSHNAVQPDAIIEMPNGQGRMALELELTAKSEKRYRELILRYRLSKDFKRVIYVTSGRQIEAKIKSVIGYAQVSDRFEFLQLTDVLVTNDAKNLHPLGERMECEL